MAHARTLKASPMGHSFRRTLSKASAARPGKEDSELKLFVLSFTAFFICIYSFIF